MSEELIERIAAVFDPVEPLLAGDERYVDCSAARQTPRLQLNMFRSIMAGGGNGCQLFCGYTGSGKSTELNRLLAGVAQKRPSPFVVKCDANRSLNLADVDFDDILLAIV